MDLIKHPKIRYSLYPIVVLLVIVFLPLPFYFIYNFNYAYYMPIPVFIAGFFVIFIGAWYDFGSKMYLKDVFASASKIDGEDMKFIHKQQLVMTIIYLFIGLCYMLVAVLIFIF